MTSFLVYLKNREHPLKVEGDKAEVIGSALIITDDKKHHVAEFQTTELQGWHESSEKEIKPQSYRR